MESLVARHFFSLFAMLFFVAAALFPTSAGATDMIDGKPVIKALDLDALEPGKVHRLYFESVEMGSGQHWYIPVVVVKGIRPGKNVALISGVHGDELTPVATAHQVIDSLDPKSMSGSLVAVMDMNRPGMEYVTRRWPMNNLGQNWVDPNRAFPGKENGNSVERQAWLVMQKLLIGNADVAIDMHTGGNGADFALFAFAYANDAESLALAELFPVDQIKVDPGFPGTLEYALVQEGIPSITLELGGPRGFDNELAKAGAKGILNVMVHYKLLKGDSRQLAEEADVYRGNAFTDVDADTGGFVTYLVEINDEVSAGQLLAVQRNGFGEVVREYAAPVSGRIAILGTDAVRERGSGIATILHSSPDCPEQGCPYTAWKE